MSTVERKLIVLRYGELFLKGANRSHFESVLQGHVRRVLADLGPIALERGQGRLFVNCEPGAELRAMERLRRVFGLASLSLALEVGKDLDRMGDLALELVRQELQGSSPSTFRISTNRSDKQFPKSSVEVNRQLGQRIVDGTGLHVDLSDPDLVVGVEIGVVRSFIFTQRVEGSGGLPVGVSGHVSLLLSGGIDSPVAGHLMQKRGCILHPIYFHSPPYTGERTKAKVQQLAEKLAPAQGDLTLSVVPFTTIQIAIRDNCPHTMAVVLYRRMMMRIATELALHKHCTAIATGENLGQVASQTLQNMACIQRATCLPVLRPLLTYDKAETIVLAKSIGTYELSIEPYEDCCSLFVPKHPLTKCGDKDAAEAEAFIRVDDLVTEAVGKTEEIAL